MAYTILDIGAGSKAFARELAWENFFKRFLIFCGEPDWPWFLPVISSESAERKIRREWQAGRYRIQAKYNRFNLPDQSLDMVTLNSPNPLMFFLPYGVESELVRCLKTGGLFFYGYSDHVYQVRLPANFERIASGAWPKKGQTLAFKGLRLSPRAPTRIPASPTIRSNIMMRHLRMEKPEAYRMMFTSRHPESSYLYANGCSPGYELWVKR